jgi:hypothetical protein
MRRTEATEMRFLRAVAVHRLIDEENNKDTGEEFGLDLNRTNRLKHISRMDGSGAYTVCYIRVQ